MLLVCLFYSLHNPLISIVALHLYFKLAYIKLAWGGPAEQAAEHEAGNPLAKNWQDEAQKVLEVVVHIFFLADESHLSALIDGRYYKSQENTAPTQTQPASDDQRTDSSILSEFDHHRLTLVLNQGESEGWHTELR